MEVLATVASISTIISGLKGCYLDIQDIRYALQHGPKDLQDFSLKVKLFREALKKVHEFLECNPKLAKDIRQLGDNILVSLKNFLKSFQGLLPKLEYSKSARTQTKIIWYFQKKTADALLGMISRGEVCLGLWVKIEKVQSQDKRIETLIAEIRWLEHLHLTVPVLRGEVTQLKKEKMRLKRQCRDQIRAIEALQREHRAGSRDQRRRSNAKAHIVAMDVVDQFFSQTIEPLIRENANVLGLDEDYRQSSNKRRFNESNLDRSRRRSRRPPTGDVSSRSTGRRMDASMQTEPEQSLLSVVIDQPAKDLPSYEVPRPYYGHSRVSSYVSASEVVKDHREMAEPEMHKFRFGHVSARNPEAYSDQEDNRSKRSSTPAAEIVVKPEGGQNTDSIQATEEVTGTASFTDVEVQEHRRKIEQQSHEHTDNIFRNKREVMRREQEAAEAGLSSRPQGRENARKAQSRKLGRSKHLGHNPGPSNSSETSSWINHSSSQSP